MGINTMFIKYDNSVPSFGSVSYFKGIVNYGTAREDQRTITRPTLGVRNISIIIGVSFATREMIA